jgi:hypothetical protein
MDLSELTPVQRGDANQSTRDEMRVPGEQGWFVVAQTGAEVSAVLTSAPERLTDPRRTGTIDRQGLASLIDDIQQARRTGFVAQQRSRLARGGIQQQHEIVALADLVGEMLSQREAELAARGITLRRSIKPAAVVANVSLLATLTNTPLDCAARHARTPVEIRIDIKDRPQIARFVFRFGHLPDDQADLAIAATTSPRPAI